MRRDGRCLAGRGQLANRALVRPNAFYGHRLAWGTCLPPTPHVFDLSQHCEAILANRATKQADSHSDTITCGFVLSLALKPRSSQVNATSQIALLICLRHGSSGIKLSASKSAAPTGRYNMPHSPAVGKEPSMQAAGRGMQGGTEHRGKMQSSVCQYKQA